MKTLFHPHWRVILLAALIATPPLAAADTRPAADLTKETVPRLPGKFIWAELVTDNVAVARAFYGPLLGWTFRSQGDYVLVSSNGRPLAGMLQRPRPANQPQATPRWFGYLSVTDVERAQQAVTRAGGRVVAAPHEVAARGRQAVFADPEGALFGVIHAKAGDPADTAAAPGGWIWLQLLSRDAQRAATFYHKVGGYQVSRNTADKRSSDFILSSGGIARATVRTLPSDKPAVQPTWLPYVRVLDLGKAVAHAKQLGGRVLVSPRPNLLHGKVAVIADPTGGALGLLEWNPQ